MRDFEFTFRCFKVAEDLATPSDAVLSMGANCFSSFSDAHKRNFCPSSSISNYFLLATNVYAPI